MSKRHGPVAVPLGLGNRIRAAREALGWSQSELGKAVGVSKSAVSQWEKGAVQNLKLGNLFAAAQALNKDVRDLVFGEGRGLKLGERTPTYQDIPPHRLALIRTYSNLPKDVRGHIRALITILADKHDVS